VVVPLRLLHYVCNDDKARIAEAIAKPVAARPEPTTAKWDFKTTFFVVLK